MADRMKMLPFPSKVSYLVVIVILHLCNGQHSYSDYTERFARARSVSVNKTQFQDFVSEIDNFEIEGITRKDIMDRLSHIRSWPSISAECQGHIEMMIEGATKKERWAYQMLDSFGKPGSGLLRYMIEWLGNYDECMSTAIPSTANGSSPFEAKYCLAARPIAPNVNLALGTCFPSTCNNTEVLLAVASIVYPLSPTLTPSSVVCNKRPDTLDQPAIASLTVLGVFAFLLMVGTAYDVLRKDSKAPEADGLNVQTPTPVNKTSYSEHEVSASSGQYSEGGMMADSLMVSGEYTQAPLLGSHLSSEGVIGHKCISICKQIILSFSVYTNGEKLFSTKTSANTLRAVHGIRFLSMTWVILGHTYYFGLVLSMYENVAYGFPLMVERWTFDAIQYATVSVDTFFVLSGLLVVYLALDQMNKGEGRLNWIMFYVHRYIRLTAPYMFVIMVYVPLFKYWGSGPLYPQDTVDPFCKSNFWLNLLYIQNLVRADKQCMGWAWYLANDMQFYVLSPLIFVPLYHYKWLGLAIAGVFLVGTVTTAGVISSSYNLTMLNSDFMTMYYVKPYCRMGPYIVGMLTGFILYKTKCRVRMNRLQCLIGWASAAAICLAVLYGQNAQNHGHKESIQVQALYNALSRTAWGVGVAWVVVACATGYGGFVNTLLSWKALIPLSKLTYCAYLVHPVIMFYYFLSRQTTVYVTDTTMIYLFFGNLVASYMVATVVTLMFESPILGLERAILKRERK